MDTGTTNSTVIGQASVDPTQTSSRNKKRPHSPSSPDKTEDRKKHVKDLTLPTASTPKPEFSQASNVGTDNIGVTEGFLEQRQVIDLTILP